ncbi:MAG: hypothetical protein EOM19_03335 [Candidatus Moranbacteria bacterium]|nr:hypothetical protein [Candidatus Moranbacteria bacterium]
MKKFFFFTFILFFILVFFLLKTFIWDVLSSEEEYGERVLNGTITFIDNGRIFPFVFSEEVTIKDVFEKANIQELSSKDSIFPSLETSISSGMNIWIYRNKSIKFYFEGRLQNIETFAQTVQSFLSERAVILKENDFVLPEKDTLIQNGMEIEVVRVEILEEKKYESIAFPKVELKDDTLGWRERKVLQKGVKGEKEFVYNVTYHNGEEIKRNLLVTHITKEPIEEKFVQGTYVQLGKKHTGLGTWYAHTETLSAASPWLPLGSYAKVTNVENGKSVMVKINDRGPFGTNRIIDLDKVAFQQIASLGAGVIEVKVEEVRN